MLTECKTADDVRMLARRVAVWRAQAFRPPPKPQSAPAALPSVPAAPPCTVTARFQFVPNLSPVHKAEVENGRPTVRAIQAAVARHYFLTLSQLLSERRTANIVRARQSAMWLSHKLTEHSLPVVGRLFGGRDHTTVLHAIRRVEDRRARDPDYCAEIDELMRRLSP